MWRLAPVQAFTIDAKIPLMYLCRSQRRASVYGRTSCCWPPQNAHGKRKGKSKDKEGQQKMKTHTKMQKILFIILLIILLIMGTCIVYVLSKLSKLSYDDGIVTEHILREDVASDNFSTVEVPSEEVEETEILISDEEAADLGEAEVILSDVELKSDKDVFNILLLGTDERKKEFSTNARADSIMILSLNKRNKTIKLVSLQRGMGVPVLEGQYEGQYDWITHIFRYGGAALMLKTVREVLNVDVEYYVRVNFNTFSELIDAVGGVDIVLTEMEAAGLNGEVRTNAMTKQRVSAGENHLDGYDALQYARLRYTDSDWKRVERQRNVIQSIVSATEDMGLLQIDDMLDVILPLVQTNLTSTDILGLISYAPAVLGHNFEQMTIPVKGSYGSMKGMGDRNLYAVDFQTNSDILREFLYGEK